MNRSADTLPLRLVPATPRERDLHRVWLAVTDRMPTLAEAARLDMTPDEWREMVFWCFGESPTSRLEDVTDRGLAQLIKQYCENEHWDRIPFARRTMMRHSRQFTRGRRKGWARLGEIVDLLNLWVEHGGEASEDAFHRFLFRRFRVSHLRFLTSDLVRQAKKAIRTMNKEPAAVTATPRPRPRSQRPTSRTASCIEGRETR